MAKRGGEIQLQSAPHKLRIGHDRVSGILKRKED